MSGNKNVTFMATMDLLARTGLVEGYHGRRPART